MDGKFIGVGSLNKGFQVLYSGAIYKHLDDFLRHEIIDSRFFKAPTASRP